MEVSGFRPIASILVVAGLIAAIGSLLFIGNSPGVNADSTYSTTTIVKYCNDLPDNFPGTPFSTVSGVDAQLAGAGGTCQIAPGENLATSATPNTTTTFNVAAPGTNFVSPFVFNFVPNSVTINKTGDGGADGLGADIPVGEKVGGLKSLATLGTLNGACTGGFNVPFKFYNGALPNVPANPRASTNIAFPRNPGQKDRFGAWAVGAPAPDSPDGNVGDNVTDANADFLADATTLAVTNYPSYLLDLFDPDGAVAANPGGNPATIANDNVDGGLNLKPIVPIAVYIGQTVATPATTDWTDLFFVQFGSGDLVDPDHDGIDADDGFQPPNPLAKVTADLGQPNDAVLNDPTDPAASVSPINDFCSPLTTQAMLLGTTPGGQTRAKSPAAAGTVFNLNWSESYRDLDQDGWENNYDACPHMVDTFPALTDPDSDLLGACDPAPATGIADIDGDGFANGQDNCPATANGNVPSGDAAGNSQLQSELVQTYAVTAADHGSKTDQMGDSCEGPAGGGNYGSVTFTQNGTSTTIATSDTVANGRYHISGLVIAKCIGGTDVDKDGYCSTSDPFDTETVGLGGVRHAAWSGGLLSLDTDADGIGDFRETYNRTDAVRPCADNTAGNNEAPTDNWAYDFDDNKLAGLGDVLGVIPVFNTVVTPTTQRRDITDDGFIGLPDVLAFIPVFNTSCVTVPQQ